MPLPRSPLLTQLTDRLQRALPARPPVRGRRRVPGLSSDVRVDYTAGGIPHLTAGSQADLFFAQGYLTAADRLFQMDLVRRTARGELSEIFGPRPAPWQQLSVVFRGWSLVDLDHFLRQLQLGPIARASADALGPEAQLAVDAYAKGVNAYLSEGARPLECQLLGYQPRPWTAADSAIVWKMLAFQLSYGWRAGLAAEALRARFADDHAKARALVPSQRDVTDVVLPTWKNAADVLFKLEVIAGRGSPGGNSLGGSNAWALAPNRSKSGQALLCGDPHLPLRAPATGWLTHLRGGGFDVAGWSVPGAPGVVMGHNDRIAWSITSGCTLEACWALEQFSSKGDEVRTATGFAPIESETTEIFVRGERAPQRRRLRSTANGPLFEGTLLGDGGPAGYGLALRWTGHLPSPELEAILSMDRARNWDEFREAGRKVGAPSVNVVYADVDGHVGWQFVGLAPRFKARPPLGVVPGWSVEHEWDGLEDFDKLPHLLDPPDGVVISANQKLLPTGAAPQLGELFEPPYRARRIRERITRAPQLSLDEAQAVQLDRYSGFGADFRDRFVRPFAQTLAARNALPQGKEGALLSLAQHWDGFAEIDSRGAAAAWTWAQTLARELFLPALGERTFRAVFEQHNLPLLPFVNVLENKGAPYLTETELEAAGLRALTAAAQELTARCGADPKGWQLGRIRTLELPHPFAEIRSLGAIFGIGPIPWGGDGSTVNNAGFRLDGDGTVEIGPVFRHAVAVGAWDDYRVQLAGGEGGDPTSGRYRELFPLWRDGRSILLPFSAEAIAKARTGEATLTSSAEKR